MAFGAGLVAQPDRAGDLVVQLDGHRIRCRGHHVVMGSAGQDLRHDVIECTKHLVAAGFQQRANRCRAQADAGGQHGR